MLYRKIFFDKDLSLDMLYSFELQMMGVIFSIVMMAGGISLWIKRRKIRKELESSNNEITENDNTENL